MKYMRYVFRYDRTEVPKFFTIISNDARHKLDEGQVLTPSEVHDTPGWVTVGYVSKQTPLGQGTGLGFKKSELREALPEEIKAALEVDHPHGRNFRPNCMKVMDASWNLVLTEAIGNWTANKEGQRRYGSVLPVTRKDLETWRDKASAEHREMLRRWEEITEQQRVAILQSLAT